MDQERKTPARSTEKEGSATERKITPAQVDRVLDRAIERDSKYVRLPPPRNGSNGHPR